MLLLFSLPLWVPSAAYWALTGCGGLGVALEASSRSETQALALSGSYSGTAFPLGLVVQAGRGILSWYMLC